MMSFELVFYETTGGDVPAFDFLRRRVRSLEQDDCVPIGWHETEEVSMKEKDRRGVPLREWLNQELQDPEFKRHYEEASIKWRVAMQIVEARHKANLTQGELARQIGDKQQNVSRIERGEQNVTIGTLDKIAKAVGGRLMVRIESKAKTIYRSRKTGILRIRDRKRQFKVRGG